MALTNKIKAIADAIRGKTGKTDGLTLDQMATEIANISATPPTVAQAVPSISVSLQGEITARATQTEGYVVGGTKESTYQLSTQAAKTITPGTSDQTAVITGKYTTGSVKVKGDSNLKAANIAKGVSIFGVTGSLESGAKVAEGQFIPAQYTDTPIQDHPITISGLGFKPTRVIVYAIGRHQEGNATHTGTSVTSGLVMRDTAGHYLVSYCEEEYDEYEDEYYEYWYLSDPMDSERPSITLNSDGFTIKATSYGTYNEIMWLPIAYRYIAFS